MAYARHRAPPRGGNARVSSNHARHTVSARSLARRAAKRVARESKNLARLCADANDAHANHAPYSLVRFIFRNAPETSARYATASAAASRQRASAEAVRSAPMRRTTRLAKEARR